MLLAILLDAYSEVKSQAGTAKSAVQEFIDYLHREIPFLGRVGKKNVRVFFLSFTYCY